MSAFRFLPVFLLAAAVAPAAADPLKPSAVPATLQGARDAYRAKDYAKAEAGYRRVLDLDSTSMNLRLSLGWSLYQQQKFADAAREFQKTRAMGRNLGLGQPGDMAYNTACSYARAGQKDDALNWLDRALADGFERRFEIVEDEDLASLKGLARFDQICGKPETVPRTRADAWSGDIDFLVSEMRRLDPDFRTRALPPAISGAAVALKSRAARSTDGEMAVGVQRLLVRLGDGHSSVLLRTAGVRVHRLPVTLHFFTEGLVVVAADHPHEDLVGRRVRRIGGVITEDLLAQLPFVVSHDNDMGVRWLGPEYLRHVEVLRSMGCALDTEAVTLDVDAEGANVRRVILRPVGYTGVPGHASMALSAAPGKEATAPLWLRRDSEPYWIQPLPEDSALYVQFNSVRDKDGEPLAAFAQHLRAEILSGRVRDVIVDVRRNSGGNGNLLPPLVRTLAAFDDAHPGHLFVLTGRATFSAAQLFINALEHNTGAVFAGEPSSSRPDFTGEHKPFRLPRTGLVVNVSSRRHNSDGDDTRAWIPPSIPVPFSKVDYFENRDPVLEAVLEVTRARK